MNIKALEMLEYNKIKNILKDYADSEIGKNIVEKLKPEKDINKIRILKMETTEGRKIIDKGYITPRFYGLYNIDNIISKIEKDIILMADEFKTITEFVRNCTEIKEFMIKKVITAPLISSYANSMYDLTELNNQIEKCIKNDIVSDNANTTIFKLRQRIKEIREKIINTLDFTVKSSKHSKFIVGAVSVKNNRYVIPVKRSFKKFISGDVIDISNGGDTVFIEPREIKKIQDEYLMLKADEERECYIILTHLTGYIKSLIRRIKVNVEVLGYYDFIFAKAKYSANTNGSSVKLNEKGYIKIIEGIHPLLDKGAVPLNFEIGNKYNSLVITGPNTGGKTVALKTVGVLTLMVQSGLHVNASCESDFAVFKDILVDIGDGQDIKESLSTFSYHIKNLIHITKAASKETLVLVDELGSGTDPSEGMSIAIAILEYLYAKGAVIVSTTHHGEIKKFAEFTNGFENGSMDFDDETLKPLYKLKIGVAGRSNAILIAKNLGLNPQIIIRAKQALKNNRKKD